MSSDHHEKPVNGLEINSIGLNYSAFTLSLYCPDQKFENELNQDSVIFVAFLIYSAYILLYALT
jgi:hypothetical protein